MRLEWVVCDCCGSKANRQVYAVNAEMGMDPFWIVRCCRCGLHFVNPRPDVWSIGRFYGSDYYAHQDVSTKGLSLKDRARSLALDLLGGYRWRALGRLFPLGLVDVVVSRYAGPTLLDVGCGSGERAAWYRDRGFQAYGVEVSERGAALASDKGIDVSVGPLPEANYPDGFFDVVIMAHVLEHTHSPAGYLKETFRILKEDGLLAIAVPNIESHSARVLGSDWAMLDPPVHLYHFSRSSLKNYLVKSGFRIERWASKAVYPQMLQKSLRRMRDRSSWLARLGSWVRTGWIPTLLQTSIRGHDAADAVTIYCRKRPCCE
jgi:SAM-dependent methyltransferase